MRSPGLCAWRKCFILNSLSGLLWNGNLDIETFGWCNYSFFFPPAKHVISNHFISWIPVVNSSHQCDHATVSCAGIWKRSTLALYELCGNCHFISVFEHFNVCNYCKMSHNGYCKLQPPYHTNFYSAADKVIALGTTSCAIILLQLQENVHCPVLIFSSFFSQSFIYFSKNV